jgi:hypothetical protein
MMRDHPAHEVPILGGMWGASGTGLAAVADALEQDLPPDLHGMDQRFLAKHVYPKIKKAACIHDAYFFYEWHSRPFPSPRKGYEFVGEVVDAVDALNHEQRAEVARVDGSLSIRLRLKVASIKDRLARRGFWGDVG